MIIVHITDYFNEKMAYQENMLTKGQKELGHKVYVLTSNLLIEIPQTKNKRIMPTGITEHNGIKIIRTQYTFEIKKNSLIHYRGVLKHLIKINPDYIFIHDKGFYVLPIILYKIFINKKVILRMDFHSDFTNSMNSKFGKIYHRLFRLFFQIFGNLFDKYYYIAPEMGDFIFKIYNLPRSKSELLRLPGDDSSVKNLTKEYLRKKLRLEKNKIYLLHTGKLPEGKKTIELIHSIKEFDLTLLICGSITGYKSTDLKDLISKSLNVKFLGWKSSNELREFIKACDVLIQPGTLSNTFVESVCIGTPLILADTPQGRDLLEEKNGILIKGLVNVDSISKAIKDFIKNKTFYENKSKLCRDKFNYKNISLQTTEI